MKRLLAILMAALSVTTCSVSPEETPGLCSLSCGSAKITAADPNFKILSNTSDLSYTCSASQANQALNPSLIYFTIVQAISPLQNNGDNAGGDGATEGSSGEAYNQPVPSASIEPIVNGLLSDEESDNVNSPLVDGVRVPIRYQGISTPSSDWCSDSCGVVGVEVAFRCPAVGESAENTVQIHSGALFSETVKISVSTQE